MPKLIAIVVLAGISGGVCYLLANYDIKRVDGQIIISRHGKQVSVKADTKKPATVADDWLPPRNTKQKLLRIASFNLEGLNARKLSGMHMTERLTRLLDGFDVVALQDIRSTHVGSLRELVDTINGKGRHFDFAVSPEVGRGSIDNYNAFIFDQTTIELDRFKLCAVTDPSGSMRCRPLVGNFRARGPQATDAFTFILVNVHVDYDRIATELNLLDDVYRAVRAANPGEDDVVLLGSFETDRNRPGELSRIPNAGWALDSTVSTVRGDRLADNLVFDRHATSEFTGRANVVDVVRALNITSSEAAEISSHLPVWAEFSTFEGGQAGHIAEKTSGRIAK
ncbi:MAG: endonuclease/exonuclease/phosphatase [Pirellulales bacterium]|nr:endonuclease/exonuclease/phosphatase [Pirellulales bacterium]